LLLPIKNRSRLIPPVFYELIITSRDKKIKFDFSAAQRKKQGKITGTKFRQNKTLAEQSLGGK
jgi:hypothetical protein